MTEIIILAATPQGLDLARRLRNAMGRGAVVDAGESPQRAVQKALRQGRPLACILPIETVIRALAPILAEGQGAPAIVALDPAGKFVVALVEPGNGLARQVAQALGATVVATSAPETLAAPDVRLIGRKWGWKIEDQANLERVASVIQQGQPVGVYQEAGQREWWQPFGAWPHHFEKLTDWPTESRWTALLAISDRVLPAPPGDLATCTLTYRPATLTLGIVCRRGATIEELGECVTQFFDQLGLSLASLAAVGTPAARKQEPGLIAFAEECEVPLLAYAPDKLALVAPPGRLRAAAACEPAALLAAGVRELAAPKTVFRAAALAVARRPVG